MRFIFHQLQTEAAPHHPLVDVTKLQMIYRVVITDFSQIMNWSTAVRGRQYSEWQGFEPVFIQVTYNQL